MFRKIAKKIRSLSFRPPLVRQYDRIDCGPACLLSILKYYGGEASLVHIRDKCQTDTRGSTMLDLVRTAEYLGLNATGAEGEYENLMNEKLPCIAHVVVEFGLNHYVVIYGLSANKVKICDPGIGYYKLSKKEFTAIWKSKTVVLISPKSKVYRVRTDSWIQWIFRFLKKQYAFVYQAIFLGLIYTGLGLLTAFFVQLTIDEFIPSRDQEKIIFTGIFLLFLLLIRSIAGYFRQRFLIILNKNISLDINNAFLSHIFNLPKRFFDMHKTGDMTARINDSMKIQQTLLLLTNSTFIDGFVILASFTTMFLMAPILAWISILLVPVYMIIVFFKMRRIKTQQNDVMKSHSLVESSYIDSLQGIDEILGYNVSNFFKGINRHIFKDFQKKIESLGITQSYLSISSDIVGSVIIVSFLTIGALEILRGNILLGQMMGSYSLLSNILPATGRFMGASISMQGANVAAKRLRDVLLVEKEIKKGTFSFKLNNEIVISNGQFSWPKNKRLFENINLSLIKGKIVSLYGRSGAGKSTLVQILQRKYPLDSGRIYIDSIPADEIDLSDYRKNLSVVPQNIKLFNGTIAENILVGRNVPDIAKISSRINELGLTSFIDRFEYGLSTRLGEDGRKLSGGEKQILAMIRALFERPEILIVDEGFGAIDHELRKIIFEMIRVYAVNHAVLIITHDINITLSCDYIYILEKGRIRENGNPQQLMLKKNSELYKILQCGGVYRQNSNSQSCYSKMTWETEA